MQNAALAEPKQARAHATRRKLLKAASESLCELGYAGMTTTEVAQRAGVSQGALYKHFGSKHQLIAATTEHLFGMLIEDFQKGLIENAGNENRIQSLLQVLWAVFITPELYAVLDLYMVARTKEPLRQALVPVLRQHRDNLRQAACMLFPEAAAENPRFQIAIESILSVMQGAAVSAAVLPEIALDAEFTRFLEHLALRELEAPYGVPK